MESVNSWKDCIVVPAGDRVTALAICSLKAAASARWSERNGDKSNNTDDNTVRCEVEWLENWLKLDIHTCLANILEFKKTEGSVLAKMSQKSPLFAADCQL